MTIGAEALQEQYIMTPEDEAAEDAAFEAGFAGEDVEIAPPPVEETAPPEETATETPPADEPPAEEAPPQYLSRQDFDAAVAAMKADHQKSLDKVFGRLGDMQHKLEQARTQAAGISPKAKARLQEEFPEFAAILFEGAADPVEPKLPIPTTVPPGPDPALQEELRQTKRDMLALVHDDWEEVTASDEFAAWKESLGEEEARKLDTSWDVRYTSKKLTEFKSWREKQATPTEPPPPAETVNKQERLAAAVVPQGVPRSGPGLEDDDEETAMEKAFKKRF